MDELIAVLFMMVAPFMALGCTTGLVLIPVLAFDLVQRWSVPGPGLTVHERRRLIAAAGWPVDGTRKATSRDLARRKATLYPWGQMWRLVVPLEGVDLDGVTFLRTHIDDDSRTGDDGFDEVVSLHFEGLISDVLHHGFRQAWMQVESLGSPSMTGKELEVHFAPGADNAEHLLALQDAVEAVFEALRERPGLDGMVRSEPNPVIRRHAFDELASRGYLEDGLLHDVLKDSDPAMRVRARHRLDLIDGLAEDALLVEPEELVRIYRSGTASYQQVPAMLPALLTQDAVGSIEAGVRLAELVGAAAANGLGGLAASGRLAVLTPKHQQRLATAAAFRLPAEALPWLASLVARLPDHAVDDALDRIGELGGIELVPALRDQAERSALVDKERSTRIEATIRGLQADARGNVGAVSIARSAGGDLGVAEAPRPRPERQRE